MTEISMPQLSLSELLRIIIVERASNSFGRVAIPNIAFNDHLNWWKGRQDSNLRPRVSNVYQLALPTELLPNTKCNMVITVLVITMLIF